MENPSSKTAEKSARVFFALWPDDAPRAALAAWQPPLHELCGGRSMRASNLHATLIFLGDVVQHRLEALQLAAQEVAGRVADGDGFQLNFDVAHYWGHNHIVYAAAHAVPPQLARLVAELEAGLRRHRFSFDHRPYKAHVTLLRHAKWSDAPLPQMHRVAWKVRDFALVQSQSDEGGANYQVLARFPLR